MMGGYGGFGGMGGFNPMMGGLGSLFGGGMGRINPGQYNGSDPFGLAERPFAPSNGWGGTQPPRGMKLNPNYNPTNAMREDVRPDDRTRQMFIPDEGANQPLLQPDVQPRPKWVDPNAGNVKNPYYYDRFANGQIGTMEHRFSDREYINPEELKNYENRLERNKNTTARYEELKNTPITDAQRNSAMYTLAANKGYNRVGEGATDPNTVMNFLKENNIDYSDDALKSYRSPSDFGLNFE